MGYTNKMILSITEYGKQKKQKLSKAESYLRYKDDIWMEDYLTKIKNVKQRKALTRLGVIIPHGVLIYILEAHASPHENIDNRLQNDVIEHAHFVNQLSRTNFTLLLHVLNMKTKGFPSLGRVLKIRYISKQCQMSWNSFIDSNEDVNVTSKLVPFIFNCMSFLLPTEKEFRCGAQWIFLWGVTCTHLLIFWCCGLLICCHVM